MGKKRRGVLDDIINPIEKTPAESQMGKNDYGVEYTPERLALARQCTHLNTKGEPAWYKGLDGVWKCQVCQLIRTDDPFTGVTHTKQEEKIMNNNSAFMIFTKLMRDRLDRFNPTPPTPAYPCQPSCGYYAIGTTPMAYGYPYLQPPMLPPCTLPPRMDDVYNIIRSKTIVDFLSTCRNTQFAISNIYGDIPHALINLFEFEFSYPLKDDLAFTINYCDGAAVCLPDSANLKVTRSRVSIIENDAYSDGKLDGITDIIYRVSKAIWEELESLKVLPVTDKVCSEETGGKNNDDTRIDE